MDSTLDTQLDQIILARSDELVHFRRQLHASPELAGSEVKTTMMIAEYLAGHGLTVEHEPGAKGLVVELATDAAADLPAIGLRADIDAVPIQDDKEVSYRSLNAGVMHACGHDVHSAGLCGALVGLKQMADAGRLPGGALRVRAIFQPSEETGEGAQEMIRRGVCEGLDVMFGIHVDPRRVAGQIGICAGPITANCDEISVVVHGRGGHAARPHETHDPVAAAAHLVTTVYSHMHRALDSRDPCVVTFGAIHGGNRANIIPDSVALAGTLRTLDSDTRLKAKQTLKQLAAGVERMTGTHLEIRFSHPVPSVVNNAVVADVAQSACRGILGVTDVDTQERVSMGGEDFAHYLAHVNGVLIRVGCAPSLGQIIPLHSSTFDVDERSIPIAARVLAGCALHWRFSSQNLPQLATA